MESHEVRRGDVTLKLTYDPEDKDRITRVNILKPRRTGKPRLVRAQEAMRKAHWVDSVELEGKTLVCKLQPCADRLAMSTILQPIVEAISANAATQDDHSPDPSSKLKRMTKPSIGKARNKGKHRDRSWSPPKQMGLIYR